MFDYYLKEPSLRKVAAKLSKEGLKQKCYTTKQGKLKGGGNFSSNSIARQLANPIYIGKIKFNGNLFKGIHSAIIDENVYNRVQTLIKKNAEKQNLAHRSKHKLLLFGIIKCGFCNSAMTTSSTIKKNNIKYFY